MNCKRCGKYIGEYAGRGRPLTYCELCRPKDNEERLKTGIGTTDIESKMSRDKNGSPNFKREKSVIKKELKKLGLQR